LSISSNVIVKAAGVDDFGQLRGQVRIVKLDRQFEIQAKASHVPIRASDEAPAAVNRHQFRMIEWRRTSPHMTPCLQQGPNMRLGSLGNQSMVVSARQDEMHFHTLWDRTVSTAGRLLLAAARVKIISANSGSDLRRIRYHGVELDTGE
jgi:hypothetical protein